MEDEQKILIVDDDSLNRDILREILQDGYALQEAASGAEALIQMDTFLPDLVLLDIMMPGMDGYEVCRRIRADSRHRFRKVVLVSGKAAVDERLAGYEVGADDYITKPFDDEEMLAKVRIFLRLSRSEELNSLKDDLLSLFSHETRTPLTVIMALGDMLADDSALGEIVRDHGVMIRNNAARLMNFVDKISLLCDLKRGTSYDKRTESLSVLVRDVIAQMGPDAEAAGVEIDLQTDKSADLELNGELVAKAIGWIIANAIKYSDDDGVVVVRIVEDENSVTLSIRDEGEGIRKDWIDKIFDEFAVRDIIHHHKGQGLSLAIARRIFADHRASITVGSEVGKGAEFLIVFQKLSAPILVGA